MLRVDQSLVPYVHVTWYADRSGPALSILCKQRFAIRDQCVLRHGDPWCPLHHDQVLVSREDRSGRMLAQGRDLWPDKSRIDLVVQGEVRAKGRGCRMREVQLHCQERHARALVLGDRYAYRSRGKIRFSDPKPFCAIPFDDFHAYGGIDPTQLPKDLSRTPMVMGVPIPELFPGAYPRNPAGMGYWINPETLVEGLCLPNIESPTARLEPEALCLGDPSHWPLAPAPVCWGFASLVSYPRSLHAGRRPSAMPESKAHKAWSRLDNDLDGPWLHADPLDLCVSPEMMQQGRRPLSLAPASGPLALSLSGFCEQGAIELQIPDLAPDIRVYRKGQLQTTRAKRLTIHVLPTEQELRITWATQLPLVEDPIPDLASLRSAYRVEFGGQPVPEACWPAARPGADGSSKDGAF